MDNTHTLPMPLTAGSLEAYFHGVNQIPMLSATEERTLAQSYQREGDIDAARRLVLSHLRFVVKIARGYQGYGLPHADLVQEGSIGLMKAVKRFDPSVGVRLVSFAVHWIRAEIHEYILRNWRIVKIATTKAQRKLFFKLRSSKKRLSWLNKGEVESVAATLGVKPSEVLEMEKRLSYSDASFDASTDDNDDVMHSPAAYLEDHRPGPEKVLQTEQLQDHRHEALKQAVQTLDSRSRDIVRRRWLNEEKQTLHQLADEYGVSAERIRQIEKMAFKQMAALMEGCK